MKSKLLEVLHDHGEEIEIVLPAIRPEGLSRDRIYIYASRDAPSEADALCELVVHVATEHEEHATTFPVFEGDDLGNILRNAIEALYEADHELGLEL